jgi:3-oxoacyl-[acyl-carrier protein] reductase
MDLSLKGRHAVVGGASRGIGRASAIALADLGAEVTLLARNEAQLEELCTLLNRDAGQKHAWLSVDYGDPGAVATAVAARISDRPAQILVNNTGGPPEGSAHDATVAQYLDAFSRHLVCAQLLLQELLPGMRHAGFGRVINIISTSVKQPIPGLGVSNTVRGAVASWAKTLANELGPDGITVNNVLPGFTETDRLEEVLGGMGQRSGKSRKEVIAQLQASVPLRRFARAEETAAAVAFLASPAASYISGINLPVDGGRTGSL